LALERQQKLAQTDVDALQLEVDALHQENEKLQKELTQVRQQANKESPANKAAVQAAQEQAKLAAQRAQTLETQLAQCQRNFEEKQKQAQELETRNINYRKGIEQIQKGLGGATINDVQRWIDNLFRNPSSNPIL
jgi:flagellar biosynthesis chaperone FliJ